MSRRTLIASAAGLAAPGGALFTFAALADVQYADKETAGKRRYRESLAKLEVCAARATAARPAFTVHLGDLVDEGLDNLDRILPVFAKLPAPRYHVIGNHDPTAQRAEMLRRMGLRRGWYSFRVKGVGFLVLDATDLNRDSAAGRQALAALRQAKAPHAQDWNGGLGQEQLAWFRKHLRQPGPKVVFCHNPVWAEGGRADHLLWNHQEVLDALDAAPQVLAWINGHYHAGASATRRGVRHITLPGLVEHTPEESLALFAVWPDAIQQIL